MNTRRRFRGSDRHRIATTVRRRFSRLVRWIGAHALETRAAAIRESDADALTTPHVPRELAPP